MPNIKPISDLRNYTEVLQNVDVDAPVFLTKNGRGKYVIMDIRDYDREQALARLMQVWGDGRVADLGGGGGASRHSIQRTKYICLSQHRETWQESSRILRRN